MATDTSADTTADSFAEPERVETADREVLDDGQRRGLRRLNVGIGLAHLVQAGIVLALSNDLAFTVTAGFLSDDPVNQRGPVTPEGIFDLAIGPLVAVFLLFAAVDHLVTAAPRAFDSYTDLVERRRNDIRWAEYSVSSSIMIVLIAMLVGIRDVAALTAIFGVNSSMILFGILMERSEDPNAEGGPDWLPFIFGSIAGAVPWIAIGIYTLGGPAPPAFVYVILVVEFVFFMSFAVNMWLQYARKGKWQSYVYGEKAFIWLSLGAKSALAWLVFANVLRS